MRTTRCGFGPDAAIKKDISAASEILAKYLTKDLRAISRYMRIHDDLVEFEFRLC